MKFHDTLNPKIWNNEKIKPEVEKKLLEIGQAFEEYLEIPKEAVLDYRILGSNCNYNYTEHSDLDLHLVIDLNKIHKNCPIVEGYLWAMKNIFNKEHDITIYGIPVELYAEDAKAETISNGCYSVMNDEWIKRPEKIAPTTNDMAVKAKYEELKQAIEKVEGVEEAADLLKQVYRMRKAGLAEGGELSAENLAFKKLRDEGLLNNLRKITMAHMDKELSLEPVKEEFIEEKKEDKMAEVNELIFRLIGLRENFYSIHYRNTSYQDHILAQRLYESISDDIIDSLKEQVMLADRELPLQAAEYVKGAIPYMIEVTDKSRENWISVWGKVDELRKFVNNIKTDNRAFNAICDEIAGALATASALIYIQTRVSHGLNEGAEDIEVKHDEEAAQETPVDRKEYKEQETADKEVKKTVEKQSNEAAAMCEAVTALERVTERIKELGL